MKTCNKCGVLKEFSEYTKHKECAGGVRNTCKECLKSISMEYRKRKRAEIEEKIKTGEIDKTAICTRCKQEKSRDMFSRSWSASNGLYSMCRECNTQANKEWRERNPEQYSNYQKEYYQKNRKRKLAREKESRDKNKDAIRKIRRDYYKENSDKIKKRNYAYKKRRLKSDPVYYCAELCRRRISKCLQEKGFLKRGSTGKMLGCDWDQLKEHIESQFQDGMTWDNRGKWHIDHIVPLARAETIEQVEELCHYTNLQPLWAAENMSKGAK